MSGADAAMPGMVDIHCHILPGVDDGAVSTEMSLEMLRRGAGEGIEAAILTPHLAPHHGPAQEELHRTRFSELLEAVSAAGLPIELRLGAEIGFRFRLLEVARWPSGTLAQGGRYVLVDLPFGPLSPGLEQGFFELRAAGLWPILAHPERHRQLTRSPASLERLRQQDVLVQVDAGSLTGSFGRRARQAAEYMIERGLVDYVASDAHDLRRRPFSMRTVEERIAAIGGPEAATRLLRDNPGRVVRGEPAVSVRPTPTARPGGSLRRVLDRLWHR